MRYTGSCPHCGAELALTTAPPAVWTCGSCGGRATLVVPESPDEHGAVIAVEALPLRAEDEPVAVAVRKWRRPVALAAAILGAWVGLVLATAVLGHLAPRSSVVGALAVGSSVLLGFSTVLLVESALAFLVVLVLFARRRTRGLTLRRSALAVIGGIGMLLLATAVLHIWPVLRGEPSEWTPLELVVDAVACTAGAWATIRLARSAPYRHVLAVGLVLLLNGLLFELPFRLANGTWAPGQVLYTSLYVPLLLAGAWLVLRLDARTAV
jgi:hypothetical protein